jgi:hypothetical protein
MRRRIHVCHMRRRIHVCHMRRRIHVCHMRRRIHVCHRPHLPDACGSTIQTCRGGGGTMQPPYTTGASTSLAVGVTGGSNVVSMLSAARRGGEVGLERLRRRWCRRWSWLRLRATTP